MSKKYQYLFPFEKIKQGTNIVIYGAGIMGTEYLKQLLMTKYCNIVGMLDRNYLEYSKYMIPVYSITDIKKLQFDYILVALRAESNYNAVKDELLLRGVDENKIIKGLVRQEVSLSTIEKNDSLAAFELSLQNNILNIAILVSGGLGDLIIQKRFVLEIIKYVPDCIIDIYVPRLVSFAIYLYSNCKNVKNVISDLGIRYTSNNTKYDIAMHLQSTRYVVIDHLKENGLIEKYNEFEICIRKLQLEVKKEDFNFHTLVHSIYQRRIYNGINAYTAFNYNGVFNITDYHVDMPLLLNDVELLEKYQITSYITINYGNGIWKDSSKVAKVWPLEYFDKLVAMFKNEYPNIKIVQLGNEGAENIKQVDKYILGAKFEEVAHILKNSLLHIDIEGGLVHFASQLDTKCVVLFGPTPIEYFGYENNINIKTGNCYNCYGVYKDAYKCARDMEKPECMYAITPELVMQKVNEYMKEIKIEDEFFV